MKYLIFVTMILITITEICQAQPVNTLKEDKPSNVRIGDLECFDLGEMFIRIKLIKNGESILKIYKNGMTTSLETKCLNEPDGAELLTLNLESHESFFDFKNNKIMIDSGTHVTGRWIQVIDLEDNEVIYSDSYYRYIYIKDDALISWKHDEQIPISSLEEICPNDYKKYIERDEDDQSTWEFYSLVPVRKIVFNLTTNTIEVTNEIDCDKEY